jgi:RNA polymerase sigma factor (sigma-70 family)
MSWMLRRDPLADPEPLVRRVYAYVAYRIGDGPDAEDVTSETFAQALRYRNTYDSKRGEPIAWLLGIARHEIAAHFGARAVHAEEIPERADVGDLAEDTVRRIALGEAVFLLEERDRELVALRYGADLTAKQIAKLLGLRVNTVEVALHRALRRLRASLDVNERGRVPADDPEPRANPLAAFADQDLPITDTQLQARQT